MTTELGLNHFYLQRSGDDGPLTVIAHSPGLTEDDALSLWQAADPGLSPQVRLDSVSDGFSCAVTDDGRRVLAHLRRPVDPPESPHVHVLLLPAEVDPFLIIPMLAYDPFPVFEHPDSDLPALFVRHQSLTDTYDAYLTSMFRATITDEAVIAALIDCFIDGRPVAIRDAPLDPALRLGLAQGLSLGLPRTMRSALTFTTDCFDGRACTAWLKFLHRPNLAIAPDDTVFSWRLRQFEEPFGAQHWYSGWASQQVAPENNDGQAIRGIGDDPRWTTIYESTDDVALALDVYAADHAWRSGDEDPQIIRFLLDHSPLISSDERTAIAGTVFDDALQAGKFDEVTDLLLESDDDARGSLMSHLTEQPVQANKLVQHWLFTHTRISTVNLTLELLHAGLEIPLDLQTRLLEVCTDRAARLDLFDQLTKHATSIEPEARATALYNIVMAYRAQKL